MKLINTKTGELVDPAYPKTTPDHMFVQGVLDSGAIASINYSRPAQPIGKMLRWIISGTEGDIEFTIDGGALQVGGGVREIRIKTAKDEEPRLVEVAASSPDYVEGVAFPGLNTAHLFEAFAQGKDVPDFEDARRLHKLLDRIAKDAGPEYS